MSKEAEKLADWLTGMVCIHPQISEDEPGGYATEYDQKVDEAAALLRRQAEQIRELREALKEIADDYADRFDLDSPSTNPGIKSSIQQARAALSNTKEET